MILLAVRILWPAFSNCHLTHQVDYELEPKKPALSVSQNGERRHWNDPEVECSQLKIICILGCLEMLFIVPICSSRSLSFKRKKKKKIPSLEIEGTLVIKLEDCILGLLIFHM